MSFDDDIERLKEDMRKMNKDLSRSLYSDMKNIRNGFKITVDDLKKL